MTEFGGGDGGSFDGGSFDSGSFDSGSLDSGSLDSGSFDAGSIDTGPDLTSALDTTSGLDTTSDFSSLTTPVSSPGVDTSSSLGLPDTTTQSLTSFSQPGSLSPGDPGTSTLGTDTFAPTPMTTYPSDFAAATDPLAAPTTPAATIGTPTTAPVAADGLDWAGAQQTMTMPSTASDPTNFDARWSGTPTSSDPSSGFFANIPGMQSGSQSVLGLANDGTGVTNTLGGLSLGLPAFAQIGNDVGVMSGQLQTQQTSALSQLMAGMQGIGTSIGTAANGYSLADQSVAQGFGGLGTPDASTTTPAAPTTTDPIMTAVGTHHYGDSGADVTAIQNQLNAAGYNVGTADGQWGIATQAALAQYAHDNNLTMPAQPNQLDQRAIDQILNAEGNNRNFTQGGLHEIYGIRQGNPGYAGVNAASQAFGQNSAGERAAASQVVQNAYNNAGFTGFTDPGEQAAIASAIHMRGPGGAGTGVQGTSAILHGMATGTTDAHTAATPADVTAVQQMTPDQFQTSFRQAREAYDQDAYGNTTTNLNGTRQNWWSAYGHGLQNRYDAEERQFRGMSGTP